MPQWDEGGERKFVSEVDGEGLGGALICRIVGDCDPIYRYQMEIEDEDEELWRLQNAMAL